MMFKIDRSSFELKKVKLLPSGGVYAECKMTAHVDGSLHEIDEKVTNPIVPHPDLENAIRSLKNELLTSCGFRGLMVVVNAEEFKASGAQKEAAAEFWNILEGKAHVTGVHFSGEEENAGVIISGKIAAENGSNIALNSPRMRFSSDVFGFEEHLEGMAEKIKDEVYSYLFENKKGQLELFDGEE